METIIVYRSYIGIMDNKMETTIVYRRYIGIMENKMEATESGLLLRDRKSSYHNRAIEF